MDGTKPEANRLGQGFRLGDWLVEPGVDRVYRGGTAVHLRPRVMEVLVLLASRHGRVVTKEEILDTVWSTRIVADSVLSSAVAELRKAFGDDRKRPWLMETIPKRGYRLLARPRPLAAPPVEEAGPASAAGLPWPEGAEAIFVGRQAELELLGRAFREARSGRGRAVFVAGEAGSGKTALLAEFARLVLAAEPDAAVAGGRCNLRPGPAEPYLPFREALRVLSGDVEGGWLPVSGGACAIRAAEEWGSVLAEAVKANGPSLRGTLLPGPPVVAPQGGTAVFAEVGSTLRAFSAARPLLLLVDDLHWADPGSLSLLFHLARHLPRSRVLLVAAYRPEDLGPSLARHPLERVVDELVRYGGEAVIRLGDGEDREFLDALVDTVPNRLDEGFRESLFGLTEGQPLLTIELLRTLRARGALARDEDGRWVVTGAIPWEKLPTRVEAIVRERVETLRAPPRAILDLAAVDGEEFCAEVVAEALEMPVAEVVEVLSGVLQRQKHLVTASRTRTVAGRRFGFYRFRHALFQRYVYERLDAAEKVLRHDRVAEAIRALFPAPTPERDAAIARHLEKGSRPGRAAPFRLSLADRASALGAPEEALSGYTTALALLQGEAQSEETNGLCRRAEWGRSAAAGLLQGHSSAAVGEALRGLRELCRLAGDESGLVRASIQLSGHHGARGESRQAAACAREAVETAERRGCALETARALDLLAIAETACGDLEGAIATFGRAEELRAETRYEDPSASPDGDDPAVAAGCWWTLALLFRGLPVRSAARAASTLVLARRRGDPYGQGLATGLGLALPLVIGDRSAEALAPAGEVLSLAERHCYPTLVALGEFLTGSAMADLGNPEEGEARVRRALEGMRRMEHGSGRALMLGRLSQILSLRGRSRESLRAAREAVAAAEAAEELNYLPELMRIRAEAAVAAGEDPRESEDRLEEALEYARERRSLLFELRCALSLGRLRAAAGQGDGAGGDRALELVARLRRRFTEGFDEPDIVRADRFLSGAGAG